MIRSLNTNKKKKNRAGKYNCNKNKHAIYMVSNDRKTIENSTKIDSIFGDTLNTMTMFTYT